VIYFVNQYLTFDRYIGSHVSVSGKISVINKDKSIFYIYMYLTFYQVNVRSSWFNLCKKLDHL